MKHGALLSRVELEKEAGYLIELWLGLNRADRGDREAWLELYDEFDLNRLPGDIRSQLDSISRFNRQTMPKNEGGTNDT